MSRCTEVASARPVRHLPGRDYRACVYLDVWFRYQLVEANFGLFNTEPGGGVASFTHFGGFAFGFLVTWLLHGDGRVTTLADAISGTP